MDNNPIKIGSEVVFRENSLYCNLLNEESYTGIVKGTKKVCSIEGDICYEVNWIEQPKYQSGYHYDLEGNSEYCFFSRNLNTLWGKTWTKLKKAFKNV